VSPLNPAAAGALPPLSLYVHIPWCVRKCPYCDFNSHAVRDELPEQAYVAALLEDLDAELQRNASSARALQSIFIGGGTPSLFGAAAIDRLLEGVAARLSLAPDIEVTMEANPGTFERQRFAAYRSAGINRLSIGIQSFDNACLQALGRIHDRNEAIAAAEAARQLFPRLNLDLMHGLPGQTPSGALADLDQAIALQPDHLSWYQLTIEPNTEFHARPPQLPLDEALWEIQEQGQERLQQAGYKQYEISAYCQPGRQARHNLNYWRYGDYLGIGAGAHGKLSRWQAGQLLIERRHKARQPKSYFDPAQRLAGSETIAADERAFEFMLNALRLTDGVETALFETRTGLEFSRIEPIVTAARRKGLLEAEPQRLAPTLQGRLFLNDLLEMFLD